MSIYLSSLKENLSMLQKYANAKKDLTKNETLFQ